MTDAPEKTETVHAVKKDGSCRASIIIPSYNRCADLCECLDALRPELLDQYGVEVIVIDDGSSDGAVERIRQGYPHVRLIANEENLGPARSRNMAGRAARGALLLFLDSDGVVEEGWLEEMLAHDDGETVLLGCAVDYEGGRVQRLPRRATFIGKSLRCPPRWANTGPSCNLGVPRARFESLGGFDEELRHYFEDSDLCIRARKAGARFKYLANAVFRHKGADRLQGAAIHKQEHNSTYAMLKAYEGRPLLIAAFSLANGLWLFLRLFAWLMDARLEDCGRLWRGWTTAYARYWRRRRAAASMRRWLREWAVRLALVGAALGVALVLAEVILRMLIDEPATLYANMQLDPEANTRHRELVFVRQYADIAKEGQWDRVAYDPYLGWDIDLEGDRIRGDAVYADTPREGIERIVAIGDSFTYGDEVSQAESFPGQLARMRENREVLNMGAGGYGIDQAVLKYLKYGAPRKPHAVVFGIHPPNWERCTLSFNAYSKPRFVYNAADGSVTLTNTERPAPEAMYRRLREEAVPTVYLFPFLRNRYLQFRWKHDFAFKQRYYHDSGMVVQHLFTMLLESIEEDGARLLVVQIPHGCHFATDTALHDAQHGNMQINCLRELYAELRIPYLDLLEELPKRYTRQTIYDEFYFKRGDGARGHLTVNANRIVAELIDARLREGH